MTIHVAQPDEKTAVIPSWVVDLESFRRWAVSDDFPTSGWYAHLDGNLWVDANMERLSHNQIKTEIAVVLTPLIQSAGLGMFLGDRMLLTNVAAALSTEPDGMFVSHAAIKSTRVTLARGQDSLEVVGTADMVLEVISRTSRQKDRVILPDLYHRATIREYWIAEAFTDHVTLEILAWQKGGYVATSIEDGWVKSPVFEKSFRIMTTTNQSGLTEYRLEMK